MPLPRLIAVLAALATVIPPALAAEPIPIVRGTIDFAAPDGSAAREASIRFLEALPPAAPVIFLDLTIVPPAEEPDSRAFRPVSGFDPQTGNRVSLDCEAGASGPLGEGLSGIGIETGPLYPHLRLEIGLAAPEAAPFNGLFCAYAHDSGPRGGVFRLRGFFAVHTYAVPTALGLSLAPVTPPWAEAQATLEAAGR